ncbi:hypothetical protein JCM5296_000108 [Sporobolomyces johnsonii]
MQDMDRVRGSGQASQTPLSPVASTSSNHRARSSFASSADAAAAARLSAEFRSLAQPEQAADEADVEVPILDDGDGEDLSASSSFSKKLDKGKGKAKTVPSPPPSTSARPRPSKTAINVLTLDSSEEDEQLQRAIEQSLESSRRPSLQDKVGSTSRQLARTPFTPKRKRASSTGNSSDSSIEFCNTPVASTSRPRPSSSRKQPRLSTRSRSPDPPSNDLTALDSSVFSLLAAYSCRRLTRPEFIRKKLDLRAQAKELGVNFEARFGARFAEVEEGDTPIKKESKTSSRSKTKDQGNGKARDPDSDLDDLDLDSSTPKRRTKLKAKAFEPLPNALILAQKRAEKAQAGLVPSLAKENVSALEAARKRIAAREDKKRKDAEKARRLGRGVDDEWAGIGVGVAVASPSSMKEKKGGKRPLMPGAWGPATPPIKLPQSDSSESDSNSDSDFSGGGGGLRRRGFDLANNFRDLAAFHRRNNNTDFRNNTDVNEAARSLGLASQDALIPGMRAKLLPFQLISVAFMSNRELQKKAPGGILADQMGLGKTISTLALMMHRRSRDPEIKTTLVVLPLSLLAQWEDEIERFCVGQSVHLYHGSNKHKAKTTKELQAFDIVLTTHGTLSGELPKKKRKKKKRRRKGDDDDEEEDSEEEIKKRTEPGLLFNMLWYRVVVDESHIARNPRAQISKAMVKLDAVYRWALTGTPVVNTLMDLYPYHKFLRNRPWHDYKYYRTVIVRREKHDPVEAGRIADAALEGIMLRRLKTDKIGGECLVKLPPKLEKLTTLEFDAVEREIYDTIEQAMQVEINKFFRAGTLLKNFHFVLVLILRLKQLCVHPHLIADRVGSFDPAAELARATIKLGQAVVARVREDRLKVAVARVDVEDFEEEGFKDLGECPVCYDPILAYDGDGIVTECGHVFHRGCAEDILHQHAEVHLDLGDQPRCKKDERPCPLCRAPFSERSLFDLEAFEPTEEEIDAALADEDRHDEGKKEASTSSFVELAISSDDDLPPPSKLFSSRKDVKPKLESPTKDCKRGVKVGKAKPDIKPDIKPPKPVSSDDDLPPPSRLFSSRKDVKPKLESPTKDSKRDVKFGTAKPDIKPPKPVFSKPKDSSVQRRSAADVKPSTSTETGEVTMSPLIPSTKMKYILKKLQQFEAADKAAQDEIDRGIRKLKNDEPEPVTKAIVLSQWTASLDLLEKYLTANKVACCRFQGNSSAEERRDAIRLLEKDPKCRVMLLSTKAGGVGLNLTMACRVLSMDLAWSEAVEQQAFDRTYRLGQRRPVEIERVIIDDTIEERILNLQARKKLLADMSLKEGQGSPSYWGQINVPDILSLFRLKANGEREGPRQGPGGWGDRDGFPA